MTPADRIVAGTLAMIPRVQSRMALARALDLPVAMVWRKMLLPDGRTDRTARDYLRAA